MDRSQKMLVDGYNVIYADRVLKRYAQKDLNRSRAELIERLKIYLKNKAVHMTVVFDGQGGMTDVEMIMPAKLQVMYSPFGQTADELIMASLRTASNPKEYIIITSDAMDIGRAASALGAKVIPSVDFLQRIEQNNPERENIEDEKPAPNEDDTAFWLRVFSDQDKKSQGNEG